MPFPYPDELLPPPIQAETVVQEDPIMRALATLQTAQPQAQVVPPAPEPLPVHPADAAAAGLPEIAPPNDLAPPPPQPPTTPLVPPLGRHGDVAGAARNQATALQAGANAALDVGAAKLAVDAAHATRRAEVLDGHATAAAVLDQNYQLARAAARRDAEVETADWLRKLDAKVAEEPVPGRWWANQSGFGKSMYFLSLVFGTMAQSKNPALKNIGLEMISQEMDADMAEQREKLRRQVDTMKLRGEKIDRRLAERLADTADDRAMQLQRLTTIQQAALERANAPGPEDQRLAMAAAAQWAGEQKLAIASQRVDKAYAEREAGLNRDADMARATLSDRRERDISAAQIQRDYDLARIQVDAKTTAKDGKKFESTRVLPPGITGIRVVDATTGAPVATAVSPTGGLVVSSAVEKDAIQDAKHAQEHYATLRRISAALGGDEDLKTLLQRNGQLVSDLRTVGYQQARENDPRGIVTDKDLVNGTESALGGDLSSLPGRIASATFSAGQAELKSVIDKSLRDMPARVSNRLGALVDASIPGYEGNIRVDWTPKPVEIEEPGAQTTGQIDASYNIGRPLLDPRTLSKDEYRDAVKTEQAGVETLVPFKPGSQAQLDKLKADLEGASPTSVMRRVDAAIKNFKTAEDPRAVMEANLLQDAKYDKATKVQEAVRNEVLAATLMEGKAPGKPGLAGIATPWSERKLEPAQVVKIARKHGFTQITGAEVKALIDEITATLKESK